MAAYKLWPVIRWQLDFPRERVAFERYELFETLAATLDFVPSYFDRGIEAYWQRYSGWEHNAFVGPLPWLQPKEPKPSWRPSLFWPNYLVRIRVS